MTLFQVFITSFSLRLTRTRWVLFVFSLGLIIFYFDPFGLLNQDNRLTPHIGEELMIVEMNGRLVGWSRLRLQPSPHGVHPQLIYQSQLRLRPNMPPSELQYTLSHKETAHSSSAHSSSAHSSSAHSSSAHSSSAHSSSAHSSYQLHWSLHVGAQSSSGRVDVDWITPSAHSSKPQLAHWRVTLHGEGGSKVHNLPAQSQRPLIDQLWPWQLTSACHRSETFNVPIIYPMSSGLSTEYGSTEYGLSLTSRQLKRASGHGREIQRLTLDSQTINGAGSLKGVSGQKPKPHPKDSARSETPSQGLPLFCKHFQLEEWRQSIGDRELEWRVRKGIWRGWSEHGEGGEVNSLLDITALMRVPLSFTKTRAPHKVRVPWRETEWISLEVIAPEAPIKTDRQNVELISSTLNSYHVLLKRGAHIRAHIQASDSQAIDSQASDSNHLPSPSSSLSSQMSVSSLQATPAYPTHHPRLLEAVEEIKSLSKERQQSLLITAFEWVNDTIQIEARGGVPRVIETLHSRSGDCNEHSALLVTLYRAMGFPAQQVFGLVPAQGQMSREGMKRAGMGYHAWVRVWIRDQWVEVDPSWRQYQLDAAHLAIDAGDEQAQDRIRMYLGRAQVKVLEWKRSSNRPPQRSLPTLPLKE